jgi:hypothetical protein
MPMSAPHQLLRMIEANPALVAIQVNTPAILAWKRSRMGRFAIHILGEIV